ncbi:hypothetical protein MKK64_17150 [Methylobacterium sp. E-025]|uniref:hypothetical protein n=1 Tax=Methylobacterium sp. E-025 TaxID=2836561 RepID=UPI001FBBBE97|nr:hypothetical protein [Methylobacterium sp. E-025]MCJ2112912.1 hypothetical protein [Methylobacterium sp. E-025]
MLRSIKYVPACPSAGKTYQIQCYASNIVKHGGKVIIVQPTTELIDKTYEEMAARFPDVKNTRIHGKLGIGKVRPHIIKFFNKANDGGEVVFLTWASFVSLGYIHRREDWHLVIDEIPNVLAFRELKVSQSHATLTDAISIKPIGPKYALVEVTDAGTIRSLAENQTGDEGWTPFVEVASRLRSDHYKNYVIQTSYDRLVKNKGKAGERNLAVFSVLQPTICEGYASVLIAGARAEETLLFKAWSQMGVRFELDTSIVKKLRYTEHANGHLVRFYYASSRRWSKSLSQSDENTLLKDMISKADVVFPGKTFAYLSNNGCKATEGLEDEEGDIVALPAWSHGLNDFARFHDILITGAYNFTPSAIAFMADMFGITDEELRVALMCHICYQTLCRSSIRNPDSHDIKTFILPDQLTAEWCQNIFPGSTCESLNIDSAPVKQRGRRKTHGSRVEGKKISRDRIKSELKEFGCLESLVSKVGIDTVYVDDVDTNTLLVKGEYVPLFRGTCLRQANDRGQFVTGHFSMSQDRFAKFLETRSRIPIDSKNDNLQVSPAMFEADRSINTNIGNENVVFANDLWLDFDHTDLIPRHLADLFPGLMIHTYETYSSTIGDLRYRAWVPLSGPVTNEEYRRIFKMVKAHIEENGYMDRARASQVLDAKFHGLDNKRNASDKFYLPCRPADGRKKTFRSFIGKGRETLNVGAWLELPAIEHVSMVVIDETLPCLLSVDLSPKQEALRDWALDRYVNTKVGGQYDAFGTLSFTLIANGIRGWEWNNTMSIAVQRSHSKLDRSRDMARLRRFAY